MTRFSLLLLLVMVTTSVASLLPEIFNQTNIDPGPKIHSSNSISVRHDSTVGFTAWAQTSIYYNGGDVIRFTGELLNEGGAYSSVTGQFSCDVGGVYYIAITLKQTTYSTLYISVYKGEEEIMRTVDDNSRNPGVSVTNSLLVECLPGEYLVMRGSRPGSLYGEAGLPHSTFTAFLMLETVNIGAKVTGKRTRHESFVGFSAGKTSDQSYVSGDTIEFSRVLYNEGGHFKPATNRFLCPISGLYYASVAFRKQSTDPMYLCVSKSTQTFLHSVDSNSDNYYSTSSNSAVIRCQQNQTIVVQGTGEGNVDGHSIVLTTFTAMLLHADVGHRHSSFIGFSMFKKTTQSYRSSQTISFDGELMNEGNYFQLNRFVCPENAIYYISLNAKKDGTNPLVIDVEVQTVTVIRVESTETQNPASVMSNSALVRCFSGEVMRVRGAGTGSVYGHHSEEHTTFTVFMVHQY